MHSANTLCANARDHHCTQAVNDCSNRYLLPFFSADTAVGGGGSCGYRRLGERIKQAAGLNIIVPGTAGVSCLQVQREEARWNIMWFVRVIVWNNDNGK